jgi:hypothetical protein
MKIHADVPLKDRLKLRSAWNGDCLEWTACRNRLGYGRLGYKGKYKTAHRVAWEVEVGEIPAGMFVCHSCDNPPCINVKHLFLGTHADNMRDMREKHRAIGIHRHVGAVHPKAKFVDSDILSIRSSTLTNRELANIYGTTARYIWFIRHRYTWKHI